MRPKQTINLGKLILSLSDAVDLANKYIAKHQQRVTFIAWTIAEQTDLNKDQIEELFIASLFHDVGAITIEEKNALMKENIENLENHSIKGQLLLERIPEFSNIAKIVGLHHTPYNKLESKKLTPITKSAQIILLADLIERKINRDQYVLHQIDNIVELLEKQTNILFPQELWEIFKKVSHKEEFWLDLSSPKLSEFLFKLGPLHNQEICYKRLNVISTFFRDVIDAKSPFTATHTAGVSSASSKLAQLYGFSPNELLEMEIAGNFHDLGKLIIPNAILEKPKPLSKREFKIIKSHTYYSYHTINNIPRLRKISEWASFHHEKLNGNGYPFHCKSEEISTGARIMAVADVFTAIAETRPYRIGMEKNQIIKVLKSMVKNNALDKTIVHLLLDKMPVVYESVIKTQKKAHNFYYNRFAKIN